jgi:hypothetical protein
MKEYLASRLLSLTEHVVNAQCILWDFPDAFPDPRGNVQYNAKEVFKETDFLSLPSTKRQAARLYQYAKDREQQPEKIEQAAEELHTRLSDELESLTLFYVPADKLAFYNQTNLLGEAFKDKFPLANLEIIEAGNCFAFDRFTACVFHLMRAMEIALRVLFVSLGMPPRIWSTTKWSQISKRIDGKIEKNNRTLATDPDWQRDRQFYENASAFVAAVRAPMRNATMHVESVYDEAGAENVFGAVKSFMRHLATRLKE